MNRDNLDEVTTNKRSGASFTQINSEYKSFKAKSTLMDIEDYKEFTKFIRFNKSSPFFFFPYAESGDKLELNYSMVNLEWGGLYKWDSKLKIGNDTFELFDVVDVSLKEFK